MLGENIRHFRKAKGLRQEELAERVHVVRQTVSKWENGLSVPDAEQLRDLAAVLDVPVSALLDLTPEEGEADLAGELARRNEELAELRRREALRRQVSGKRSAILAWSLAALLCALLSTGAGMVMAISHVVCDDLIDPCRKVPAAPKRKLWTSRIVCVIVTLAAAIPALKVEVVIQLFFWCFSLSLPIFICYLIGMWWKVSRPAAWINLFASLAVNFWWTFACPSWCPPQFSLSFYPVFVVTVVLGIVLNLVLPGKKGLLRQIKDQEMAERLPG